MSDGLRDSGRRRRFWNQKDPIGAGRGGMRFAERTERVSVFTHETSLIGAGRLLGVCAVVCVLVCLLPISTTWAQPAPGTKPDPAPAQPQVPEDALGRQTPRGTVLGFLNAAKKGDYELASQYLRAGLSRQAAAAVSQQLFIVLDARLPARLTQLSDAPEGSGSNPLMPNQELVGVIESTSGNVDVVLDRVPRRDGGLVWLFSDKTLDAVPVLYQEVTQGWGDRPLGRLLTRTRLARGRLLEWFVVLLGLPLFYLVTVGLNRVLSPLARRSWRRLSKESELFAGDVLPMPVRLLLLALAIRWFLSNVALSLFVRQFWANAASLIMIVAVVWLLILLNGEVEASWRRRVPGANVVAAASLLRLLRRAADALVICGGLIAVLRVFGVDPTPALAGLGVGGIAVALAAQKTLENVIAGASLIFDQAVRVGDFLKMGEVLGTVDHIGLRSTRIRTPDRTVVSVPNSQIANATLETISMRDKYWFHPVVGLRYETTPAQLREVVDGIRWLLETHPLIDSASVRVRFLRLGSFSLDVDVSAYLLARDWDNFLEVQEHLLLSVTEIVDKAGARIALPSQMTYLADTRPQAATRIDPHVVSERE